MRLDAGDLVLVPFPFSDLTSSKTRPALVLSSRSYNDEGRDIIVCGVTSNLANTSHSVLIEARDMVQGRLVATSRVKVDKLATLHQGIVRKRVGAVKPAVMGQVLKELLALLPSS